MNRLYIDTETTSIPDAHQLPGHPAQPHLVQVGAVLFDGDWTERACLSLIVKPEGWTVPAAAQDVHGISTADALKKLDRLK